MDAAAIRAGLGHPVIDADGHGIEYLPWFRDLLRDEGGGGAVDAWDVVEHSAGFTRTLDVATKRSLGLFAEFIGLASAHAEQFARFFASEPDQLEHPKHAAECRRDLQQLLAQRVPAHNGALDLTRGGSGVENGCVSLRVRHRLARCNFTAFSR